MQRNDAVEAQRGVGSTGCPLRALHSERRLRASVNVALVGMVALALTVGIAGSALAQDDAPVRLAEGGLAVAGSGGDSEVGGYGAIEVGGERYGVWAGVEGYGGGTSVSGAVVFRVPVQPGVRATAMVGVSRAARGGGVPFGGGGVTFGGNYGGRVTVLVGRGGGATHLQLLAGGYIGF